MLAIVDVNGAGHAAGQEHPAMSKAEASAYIDTDAVRHATSRIDGIQKVKGAYAQTTKLENHVSVVMHPSLAIRCSSQEEADKVVKAINEALAPVMQPLLAKFKSELQALAKVPRD